MNYYLNSFDLDSPEINYNFKQKYEVYLNYRREFENEKNEN